MTTLEGSIEGWWLLPSPKLDFSKEVENFCELAARRYGTALRAIIVLNGSKGEFYIALFSTSDFPTIMLNSMREAMSKWEMGARNSVESDGSMPDDPMMYLRRIDPQFTTPGARGIDWDLPNQVTVFYYYPKDLVFPKGWDEIPQKILQSSQRK